MVKGISKQVIVVHAPEEKLFEQAIFILNERAMGQDGITNEALMKEARQIMGTRKVKRSHLGLCYIGCVLLGALAMGGAWLLSVLL